MDSIIFDLQRGCLHDGPGIRTTVFLKGCNLRCPWCHNPESLSPAPQLQWNRLLCQHCGRCTEVCPNGAHRLSGGEHRIDLSRCSSCGKCVSVCAPHALEIVGARRTCDEVMNELRKDRAYYAASGGGVTFSGGEPTLQTDFVAALAQRCQGEGMRTALETNGYWPQGAAQKLLPCIDLFLLDFKLAEDSERILRAGQSPSGWLNTLQAIQDAGKPVLLRCPMIPTVNDNDAFLTAAAALYHRFHCISRVELLGYHTIGVSKWERIGQPYTLAQLSAMSAERLQALQEKLNALCGPWRETQKTNSAAFS